jgi:malate dehydrogenase
VGAGNVGATCAQELARRDYADVVLVDIIPDFPQGKALDLNQAGAVLGYEPTITGANGYDESKGSDVVVVTAGKPRSPGMSRDDLVTTNEAIVGSVTKEAVRRSPGAVLVIVSNPLDAMCHVAKAASRFPKHRVVGMAGILDTARFAAFVSHELGVSVKDVTAVVLGGHGDQMVPVVSATNVGGVPLPELMSRARIRKLVERTKFGGGEIVGLLGTSAGTRQAPPRRRWWTPSAWTRSACSRARRTSRASTASTVCTWASRRGSAREAWRRSSDCGSPQTRRRCCARRRRRCARSSGS